jgi:hypothetical protein
MSDIDWTCGGEGFFYGENEERLLRATLNEIELEELPLLIQTLNSFIDGGANGPVPRVVKIDGDGCDDALICLDDGTEIPICSETTVGEMMGLLY